MLRASQTERPPMAKCVSQGRWYLSFPSARVMLCGTGGTFLWQHIERGRRGNIQEQPGSVLGACFDRPVKGDPSGSASAELVTDLNARPWPTC